MNQSKLWRKTNNKASSTTRFGSVSIVSCDLGLAEDKADSLMAGGTHRKTSSSWYPWDPVLTSYGITPPLTFI